MKLPLQLVASMLVASACGSVWPYHGASALLGPPAYIHLGVPEANPSSTKSAEEAPPTVITGPTSGPTIMNGAVASPTTIISGSPNRTRVVSSSIAESSVLIKGASAGPVTLLAPSDARVSVIGLCNGTTSGCAGSIVTGQTVGGAGGSVLVAGERGAKISGDATASSSTGTVSVTAVIGPSIGPIVVAGPTAVPATLAAPVTIAEATDAPATVSALVTEPTSVAESTISTEPTTTPSTVGERTSVATVNADSAGDLSSATASSSVVASASAGADVAAGDVTDPGKIATPVRGSLLVKGTDVGTTVVGSSAASSASVSRDSKSSAFAAAKIDLIESVPVLAVGAAPVSNVVLSAPVAPYATLVSGPSGSVSTVGAPGLLVSKTPSLLLRKW